MNRQCECEHISHFEEQLTPKLHFRTTHRLLNSLEGRQKALELLINATPTSATRNLLTEANIHLMLAIDKLKELHS